MTEHNPDAERRAWSRRWGIKVGKPYPCPTRWFTRRKCRGQGCCWFAGGTNPRALDHVYGITRLTDSRRGLLAMPYMLGDDSAAQLTEWCASFGLGWTVLGDGWHYPGTVAIVMFPKDTT